MKLIIATIVEFAAVAMFVFSYQAKKRKALILFNGGSRLLYVTQYILRGAFDAAVMDTVAFFVSMTAEKKKAGWINKHLKLTMILANLAILSAGLLSYQSPLTFLAIAGVLFETGALWLTKESHIRIVAFFGAPCWLVYNFTVGAYLSAAGNALTIISIGLAILRHDIKRTKKEP